MQLQFVFCIGKIANINSLKYIYPYNEFENDYFKTTSTSHNFIMLSQIRISS